MLPMKKAITNKNGFTLVELIVSIAIISILLIAGAMFLSSSLVTISNEGTDTQNLYQAKDAMEKLVSGEITDLDLYPELILQVDNNASMTLKDETNTSYTIVGKYYIIKEKKESKIVLKAFVPTES